MIIRSLLEPESLYHRFLLCLATKRTRCSRTRVSCQISFQITLTAQDRRAINYFFTCSVHLSRFNVPTHLLLVYIRIGSHEAKLPRSFRIATDKRNCATVERPTPRRISSGSPIVARLCHRGFTAFNVRKAHRKKSLPRGHVLIGRSNRRTQLHVRTL